MLKKFLKMCSFVLSIILLVNMLPMQIYALEIQATDTVKPVTGETDQEVTILGEITEKRTEYTKEFRLSNGLNLATVYAQPVHYEEDGQWKEIDNTLVATTAGFKNTSGVWDVTFPQNMRGSNGVTIEKDGHTFVFYMSGQLQVRDGAVVASADAAETFALQPATEANAQVQKIDLSEELEQAEYPETIVTKSYSRLQYSGVFTGTDIVYDLAANQVKESIVIQKADDSLRGYRYTLNTGDMIPVLEDSGEITLYDKSKETVVMTMPAPFLQDQSGLYNYDVEVTLTGSNGVYTLSYILPHAWMQAEDRRYPVILDPIVEAGGNRDNVEDLTVYQNSQSPASSTGSVLKVGKSIENGIMRSYVRFLTLPQLADTDIIVEATFSAKVIGWFAPEVAACVHKVTGAWPAINQFTWANQPSIDTSVVQDFNVPDATDTVYYWDVTEIVRDWYLTQNNGLVLRGQETLENQTVDGNYMIQLASEEYSVYSVPGLSIAYRSAVGIEPYYTYATLGAGNAGGVYLSDSTGQITAIREVASYASTVNPFSANLIYNSAYFVKNNTAYSPLQQMGLTMKLGAGWTLDLVQKLEPLTIGETSYLRYYDGDGTVHCLKLRSGKYCDEDGLDLEVVANADGSYTMSDAMDNTWKFTALPNIFGYFLTSSLDNNGNGYTLNYSGGKLISVVQNNRNQSAITVATFTYNQSNNFLISVTDAAAESYSISYTGENLTALGRQGDYAAYGYSGCRLTSMTDKLSNYSLNFSYHPGSSTVAGGRVSSYWESHGSTIGIKCNIEYPSYTYTIYHSCGVDRVINTTNGGDDLYHHYLFDYAGRTVNAYTTDGSFHILGASTAVYTEHTDKNYKSNNRTERTATVGVPAQNLIPNSSFEAGTADWTLVNVGLSEEETHYGKNALKGTTAAATATRTVSLVKDQPYTLSAYVRTTANSPTVHLQVTIGSKTYTSAPVDYATVNNIDGDWERIYLTFTPEATGNADISITGTGSAGSFYADNIQLEKGEGPSNYNLLENGNMEATSTDPGGYVWQLRNCLNFDNPGISGSALQIIGDPNDTQGNTFQRIKINRMGSQSYVLSGWAKANAVTDNITKRSDPAYDNTKQFGLRAKLTYKNDTNGISTEYYYVPFNPDVSDWQYVSLTITPDYTNRIVDEISVSCVYESNANIALFDNISLVSTTVQQASYDPDTGRLITSSSTGINGQSVTYDSHGNVASVSTRTGSGSNDAIAYAYTYDSTFIHRVATMTQKDKDASNKDITYTYTYGYDAVGNVTGTVFSSYAENESLRTDKTISGSATYTNSGNLIASSTDAAGKTTTYGYSGNRYRVHGHADEVTDGNRSVTTSNLDIYGRVTDVNLFPYNSLDLISYIDYTYSEDRLTSLKRVAGGTQTYRFAYDVFGNSTSVRVDNWHQNSLVTYDYGTNNSLLKQQTYGNNASVSYTYDILGRVKTAIYSANSNPTSYDRCLKYTYTGDGQPYQIEDSKTGYTYTYTYDSIGRLESSWVKDSGGNILLRTRQVYNANNQVAGQQWTVGGTTYSQVFSYDNQTGLLSTMAPGDGSTLALTYDGLQRLSSVSGGVYSKTYTYRDIPNTNHTTTQVTGLTYDLPQGASDITYGYSYDQYGNIATYTQDGTTYTYTYDIQNQLTKQTGGSKTYTYTYDAAGNILTASNGTTSHSYTYGNSAWRDLLTAYDGVAFVYDAVGNPTTYYNGTTWGFTWAEGRNLVRAEKINRNTNTVLNTYTYAYDQNGVRTKKSVDGVIHNYFYASGKLLRETWGTNTLDFFYNENGHPYAVTYTNSQGSTTYYYVTNLQGDVLRIVNTSGTIVASYTYDPYGKVLTATGSMATVNPLRYRGYYYDQETGLYYLQSRYYDPTTCRFINADSYASTGQGIIGHNMFAYCNNSPHNATDPYGEDAIWLQDTNNRVTGWLGHTGLLIQDATGAWYYFNWNNSGGSFYYVDPEVYDYSKIEELKKVDGERYDAAIYFEGDFSLSIKYAEMLAENTSEADYDFAWNNCMQVVTDVLSQGSFAQSDESYKAFLSKVRYSFVPNLAFSRTFIFHNTVQTYHAAPDWAKWLYTSPERAVQIY